MISKPQARNVEEITKEKENAVDELSHRLTAAVVDGELRPLPLRIAASESQLGCELAVCVAANCGQSVGSQAQ